MTASEPKWHRWCVLVGLIAIGWMSQTVRMEAVAGDRWIGSLDAASYANQARSLAEGDGLLIRYVSSFYHPYDPEILRPDDHWPPGIALVIAPIFMVLGATVEATKLASMGVSSFMLPLATAALAGAVGRSSLAALLAGTAVLLTPEYLRAAVIPMSDLQLAAISAGFLACVVAGGRWWLLAGVLGGLGWMTKASYLLLVPLFPVLVLLVHGPGVEARRGVVRGWMAMAVVMMPYMGLKAAHYGSPFRSTQSYTSATIGVGGWYTEHCEIRWGKRLPSLTDRLDINFRTHVHRARVNVRTYQSLLFFGERRASHRVEVERDRWRGSDDEDAPVDTLEDGEEAPPVERAVDDPEADVDAEAGLLGEADADMAVELDAEPEADHDPDAEGAPRWDAAGRAASKASRRDSYVVALVNAPGALGLLWLLGSTAPGTWRSLQELWRRRGDPDTPWMSREVGIGWMAVLFMAAFGLSMALLWVMVWRYVYPSMVVLTAVSLGLGVLTLGRRVDLAHTTPACTALVVACFAWGGVAQGVVDRAVLAPPVTGNNVSEALATWMETEHSERVVVMTPRALQLAFYGPRSLRTVVMPYSDDPEETLAVMAHYGVDYVVGLSKWPTVRTLREAWPGALVPVVDGPHRLLRVDWAKLPVAKGTVWEPPVEE